MSIFHIVFQRFQKNYIDGFLTFSIENIKSRVPCVAYLVVHCYNYDGDEILVDNSPAYVGERFVITSAYNTHVETFDLDDVINNTLHIELELVAMGITSENPLWFNKVMLENASTHTEYHKPAEAEVETDILYNNNNFAVLYNLEGNGLQVIRPQKDKITTKKLLASKYTILAPHLDNEPKRDTPASIMLEYINQVEQEISIFK